MNSIARAAFCLFFFISVVPALHAQDTVWHSTYILDRFTQGFVFLKSGAVEKGSLNYDAARQGISFLKDNKVYDLTGIENVDSVYIGDRKFIAARNVFYEWIAISPVELYATYSCKTQLVRAVTDHNGTSRKNMSYVSNAVSEVYLNRPYREGFVMEFRKQYWLKRYRDFYKANSERNIIKLFPRKEKEIRDYVKTHKTNFSNQTDVARLLAFCLE